MRKIQVYVAAWKLKKLAEQKQEQERPTIQPYADFGDNGTEAPWAIVNVDNFC
jgi:hypothetical protein